MSRVSVVAALVLVASLSLTGCSAIVELLSEASGSGSTGSGSTGDSGDGIIEGTGDQTDIFDIAIGDCLNDGVFEGEANSVPVVDCSELHESEAYSSFLLSGTSYPGQEDIETSADDGCYEAFEEFVGIPWDDSTLDYSYYFPTKGTWRTGDREILCLVHETDENEEPRRSTGTLENARR